MKYPQEDRCRKTENWYGHGDGAHGVEGGLPAIAGGKSHADPSDYAHIGETALRQEKIQGQKENAAQYASGTAEFYAVYQIVSKGNKYRHRRDTRPHRFGGSQTGDGQKDERNPESKTELPPGPGRGEVKFPEQAYEAAFVGLFPVIPVIYQSGQAGAGEKSRETALQDFAGDIISLDQKIGQNQSGMVEHYDIVTSQQYQQQDACGIDTECPAHRNKV